VGRDAQPARGRAALVVELRAGAAHVSHPRRVRMGVEIRRGCFGRRWRSGRVGRRALAGGARERQGRLGGALARRVVHRLAAWPRVVAGVSWRRETLTFSGLGLLAFE